MYALRLADPADLPAIVSIYNSTVASRVVTADTEPVTVESRLGWYASHQRPDRPLWVAEPLIISNDRICADSRAQAQAHASILGWMSLSDFYGRPAYSNTVEISIYCHPSVRRRGLGSFLLASAIASASELEINTFLGFVFSHNEASVRLFRKYGFETWGSLPRVARLDEVERDLQILGRRITL
jgi:phosphinothricin acetyltransferase